MAGPRSLPDTVAKEHALLVSGELLSLPVDLPSSGKAVCIWIVGEDDCETTLLRRSDSLDKRFDSLG